MVEDVDALAEKDPDQSVVWYLQRFGGQKNRSN